MLRGRTLLGSALAAVLLAGAALTPASVADASPDGRQHLQWTTCAGALNPDLRCARVTVPLDYSRPRGRKIQIMISRLVARDPAQRRGVLLSSNGGPGQAGGLFLPEDYNVGMKPEILNQYDLIGFDVRFLEQSTPITCGQPQEEPEGFWNHGAPTRALFDTDVSLARQYAKDCWANAGWALPHATLENIARDMDVIRQALGERRISFLGADALGTAGAIYATLFPKQVDRFVLDTPLDPNDLWRPSRLERLPLQEKGFDQFAGWIAARDDQYHLGTTGDQVKTTITGMWQNPPVAGGRQWTADELVYYTLLGVFFDYFAGIMAANLSAIHLGQTPPNVWPLYPTPRPGIEGVPVDNHTAMSTAFQCDEAPWPTDVESYWRDVQRLMPQYPDFGPGAPNVSPCTFWPTRDNRISIGGGHTPPVLVLGATDDSIAPYEDARAVTHTMRGSRLITDNLRDHGLFPFIGSDCLKANVTDYLATGKLPKTDVNCPAPSAAA